MTTIDQILLDLKRTIVGALDGAIAECKRLEKRSNKLSDASKPVVTEVVNPSSITALKSIRNLVADVPTPTVPTPTVPTPTVPTPTVAMTEKDFIAKDDQDICSAFIMKGDNKGKICSKGGELTIKYGGKRCKDCLKTLKGVKLGKSSTIVAPKAVSKPVDPIITLSSTIDDDILVSMDVRIPTTVFRRTGRTMKASGINRDIVLPKSSTELVDLTDEQISQGSIDYTQEMKDLFNSLSIKY